MSNGPGATGTLAATPLAELLIYALDKELQGSLVFEDPDGNKSALTLRDGVVVNSRLAAPKYRLGEVCVQLAMISEEGVRTALENAGGRLIGEALLEAGLTKEELDRALYDQLLLHVQFIAGLPPQTVYGFYANKDFLLKWGGPRRAADALAMVWRAARSAHNPRALRVVQGLQKLDALKLHRHSRVGRFGFSSRESALLDVIRAKPHSYEALSTHGLLEPDAQARVLYVLALTGHLDLGARPVPLGVDVTQLREARTTRPVASADGPAAPKAHADHEQRAGLAERQQEIESMAAQLEGANYYELFGLAPGADLNAIQAAFFQSAKKWHPDKLPPELADYREAATRIFSRMTEAHKVLSTPAQRTEYDRLTAEGGDSEEDQAKVQQVLRAATSFQKAEIMARRGDWGTAEKLAKQAYDDDPEQAEYGALYAYAVMKAGSRNKSGDYGDLLELLHTAVRREPKNMRVKLYRGQMLKQAGRVSEAMRDFRAVVEAEPTNVEAQRELRLFKMRRGDPDETKPDTKGVFGKLFGKS